MLGLNRREIEERFDEIVEFAELRALHRRAREDLLLGHVHAARLRRGHPRGPRGPADRRGPGRGRRGLHPEVPRQDRRVPPPRQDHPDRDPQPGPRREDVRRRAVAAARARGRPGRSQARGRRLPDLRGRRGGGAPGPRATTRPPPRGRARRSARRGLDPRPRLPRGALGQPRGGDHARPPPRRRAATSATSTCPERP